MILVGWMLNCSFQTTHMSLNPSGRFSDLNYNDINPKFFSRQVSCCIVLRKRIGNVDRYFKATITSTSTNPLEYQHTYKNDTDQSQCSPNGGKSATSNISRQRSHRQSRSQDLRLIIRLFAPSIRPPVLSRNGL